MTEWWHWLLFVLCIPAGWWLRDFAYRRWF